MSLVSTDPVVITPDWHRVPARGGWIHSMHCMPDMADPNLFILTMDGPQGGEYGRIKVSRSQLLEMIVESDKERDRVNLINRGFKVEFPDVTCLFCGEELDGTDTSEWPIGTPEGPRQAHQQCMLRSGVGGIGHLLAHDYWCTQQGDPDAGLTYRQSALMVDHWVRVVGLP